MITPTFAKVRKAIDASPLIEVLGMVSRVTGIVVESDGPNSRIGDLCFIEGPEGDVAAEVVGFSDEKTLPMPLG